MILPLELAQRGLLLVVQRFAFGAGDPVADLRRRRLAVIHAGQRRHRLGARLAAADRHVRRLVGAEDRQRVLQRLQAVAEFIKLCEGHVLLPNPNFGRQRISTSHGAASRKSDTGTCAVTAPQWSIAGKNVAAEHEE